MSTLISTEQLLLKYNVPVPRYTSYPTVPMWDSTLFGVTQWKNTIAKSLKMPENEEGIAIYVHLPFCEQLCTFCGCHKIVTKNHQREDPYIELILKEWQLYLSLFDRKPKIKEIHLGGGSPTFFSAASLEKLITGLLKNSSPTVEPAFSFEGNPRTTNRDQLQTLYNLGFTRVSFGVQDYDRKVQIAINRLQDQELVERVTHQAREIGYTSVGHDLIYGLPFQTAESITKTIEITNKLRPDRIAFYSYAHVPWLKGNGQRGFDEKHLPAGEQKRALYELGNQLLIENGYHEVGMDHFALANDELFIARAQKKLHRNFMGYTTTKSKLMIGLGVSSISDSWLGFAQNEKSLLKYQQLLENNELPVVKGHILTAEDLLLRQHILNLSCHYSTDIEELPQEAKREILPQLLQFKKEGLVSLEHYTLKITESGKPFLRNICSAFDMRLKRKNADRQQFSMSI